MAKLKCIKLNIKLLKTARASTPATKRITGRRCQQIRRGVALDAGFICQSCGRLTADGEVDHIIPLHLGGQESSSNRQWLCVECHESKSKGEGDLRATGG